MRSSHSRPKDIPFDDICDAARPFIVPLVRRWCPKLVPHNGWLTGPSPLRVDKNPSFGVSLATGRFRDFATGDRGSIVDLYARLHNVSLAEAAKSVARAVGHPFADPPQTTRKS